MMLPNLTLRLWNKYRVSGLSVGSTIIEIIHGPSKIFYPDSRIIVYLKKDKGALRLGEARVEKILTLPLGAITPNLWIMHLGDIIDCNDFLGRELPYGLENCERDSVVMVIKMSLLSLDKKFLVKQS